MAVNWGADTLTTQTGAVDAQADRVLNRSRSLASGASFSSSQDAKIVKAGKDFESVLLGNWLQQAQQSFATVPGGDAEDEDEDGGKNQFQGIAMQALAGSLTASGGIGIAQMITRSLRSLQGGSRTLESSAGSPQGVSATSPLNKSP